MSGADNSGRTPDLPERDRGRRTLVFLAIIFIGPLVVAWILYARGDWRPAGTAANGELISPAVELPASGDGLFRDAWWLVVVAPADCDDACTAALIRTQRLHLSLGRETDRVRRVLLVGSAGNVATTLAAEDGDLVIVSGGDAAVLTGRFPGAAGSGDLIFLVDPLGNLMMRFDGEIDLKSMQSDLKRLLRLSRIG